MVSPSFCLACSSCACNFRVSHAGRKCSRHFLLEVWPCTYAIVLGTGPSPYFLQKVSSSHLLGQLYQEGVVHCFCAPPIQGADPCSGIRWYSSIRSVNGGGCLCQPGFLLLLQMCPLENVGQFHQLSQQSTPQERRP